MIVQGKKKIKRIVERKISIFYWFSLQVGHRSPSRLLSHQERPESGDKISRSFSSFSSDPAGANLLPNNILSDEDMCGCRRTIRTRSGSPFHSNADWAINTGVHSVLREQ